jgi:hypothetical protein
MHAAAHWTLEDMLEQAVTRMHTHAQEQCLICGLFNLCDRIVLAPILLCADIVTALLYTQMASNSFTQHVSNTTLTTNQTDKMSRKKESSVDRRCRGCQLSLLMQHDPT